MKDQQNTIEFDIVKYDSILGRGLCFGVGSRDGQMCIEAAICAVLDLPHGDDPGCVAASVRSFKIALNDSVWSSPEARAKGLRDLGLAQLGSKGVVDDAEFSKRLAEKVTRTLIPTLFRKYFPNEKAMQEAAGKCETEGTSDAAYAAYAAARAAADAAYAAYAAAAAADAAADAADKDEFFVMVAGMALEVLRELNSPGVKLLGGGLDEMKGEG